VEELVPLQFGVRVSFFKEVTSKPLKFGDLFSKEVLPKSFFKAFTGFKTLLLFLEAFTIKILIPYFLKREGYSF